MHLSPSRTGYLLSSGLEGNIITAVFSHWAITPRGGNMWYSTFKQMILNLTWFVNKYENQLNSTSEVLQEEQEQGSGPNLIC